MSDKPVALVTVRASSGRLPKKCFLPLGKASVLEHVVNRALSGGLTPIICTSTDSSDDEIIKLAERLKIPTYRGDLENKLNRWHTCLLEFNLNQAHLLDADDPYFDPIEIQESYGLLVDSPYDLVLTSSRSDSGFASVGTSIKSIFLGEIVNRSKALKSTNFDVIPWELLLHEGDKVTRMPDRNLGLPEGIDLRLTLDYPEDHELLSLIAQNFSFDAPRIDIEQFLLRKPELRQMNLFRSQDFLQNKRDFKHAQFS